MKNKICRILLFFYVFMTVFISTCYALDSDTEIRVRIRKPRNTNEQVELQGYGNISVYNIIESKEVPIAILDEKLNIFLDTYYSDSYLAQSANSSNSIIGPYHLKLKNQEYADYSSANSNAIKLTADYGFSFYPFYNGKSFNIYAGNFLSDADASKNRDKLIQAGISCETINGNSQLILVLNSNKKPVLMYTNNFNIYFSSYSKEMNCKSIIIDKTIYRGDAAFNISESRLISINKVNMKYYLYGVIPNEVVATWHSEAIKAQILASRSYAVSFVNPNSKLGYDVQDNQNDQVYGGYKSENSITNALVDNTDGQMIYYDGKVITAYYHSTSGGKTEHSENIWVTPVPYLRSVDDPYSNNSPLSTWKKSLTKENIITIAREINPDVKDVCNIVITDVSENGRVLQCIISTNAGDIILKKEDVRATLGYNNLPSSWFNITTDSDVFLISENSFIFQKENGNTDSLTSSGESLIGTGKKDSNQEKSENNNKSEKANPDDTRVSLNDKKLISSLGISKIDSSSLNFISSSGISKLTAAPTIYYFNGRGNGHGIGMSQYGALKMAEEGYTYEQILKYYYTGVEIK
jgi:stage II sporulation protein D